MTRPKPAGGEKYLGEKIGENTASRRKGEDIIKKRNKLELLEIKSMMAEVGN